MTLRRESGASLGSPCPRREPKALQYAGARHAATFKQRAGGTQKACRTMSSQAREARSSGVATILSDYREEASPRLSTISMVHRTGRSLHSVTRSPPMRLASSRAHKAPRGTSAEIWS